MKALFLIALVLYVNLSGIQAACGSGTLQVSGSYCNCFAGTAPDYTQGADNCLKSVSTVTDPTPCSAGSADGPLVSGYNAPTFLDSNIPVKFDHDRVVMSFAQPVVQNAWYRRETYIKFYRGPSSVSPIGDTSCQYPGSMWTKEAKADSCKDVYTVSMPFSRANFCGFQKAVTPSTLTYTTTVKFEYTEVSDTVGTYDRRLSNLFTVNIQLVRQTAITAALNLLLDSTADATVDAFVIGTSSYDLLSGQTRVVFQTHTSWPYQIGSALTIPATSGPVVTTHPTGTATIVTPDYLTPDNCPKVSGADCVQQFEIIVSRADPALCDFFGEYIVDTELVCADTDSCTPAEGPKIIVNLDHANVCAPPVVDTGVSATQSLLSFNDKALGNTQTDFETGDVSYWTFTIVDPMISIDSVTLNSVVLSLVDNPDQLPADVVYSVGNTPIAVISDIKEATNVVHPPGTPVVVSFGLSLNRGLLPNTVQTLEPGDSVKGMNLAVVVDVQYHGNKKRSLNAVVSPANNGGAASTAHFVVRSKEFTAANTNTAAVEASNCTGFCVALSLAKRVMGALGL